MNLRRPLPIFSGLTICLCFCVSLRAGEETVYQVGLGKADITPAYPVRLNGFGNRRQESVGVSQRLFARAMAISQGEQPPLVVVAIDNLGIRLTQVDQVAEALRRSYGLPRENFALTFTHTHCAPKVNGATDNIFSQAIPADHQQHIDRYTAELIEQITAAAREAIQSRRPSVLHYSIGDVGFAKNRRPQGGPVDHDLPALIVHDAKTHQVRGVFVSYACHCVTMRFNQLSGDWAGYAAEMIERQFPGSVALVAIGAGSDQNPSEVSPDDIQVARRQGAEIASEVQRLAAAEQRPITGRPAATLNRIKLKLNDLPTREQLVETAQSGPRPTDRYNAQTQLARLDRGESLISAIDYPIQTWVLGDSLCMNFLGGEVCVDYAVRLKQELDRRRFWLIGYSNDFCSYIPSERLVQEGGYGGGSETPYFALPATLAGGLEQQIIDEVHRQVPDSFQVPQGVQGVAPQSPREALRSMRTHAHLQVELAAAEPQVHDPVAIDFGVDGCVWVAEMNDYGRGVYESFAQSGRIRCLRDKDGDGRFEHSQTFLVGLRFPTDVKVWRDGLLICDAPHIIFARDTDGDGVADRTEKLYSGFDERNAQARVNSLRWGLDNWVYGSCGLFGGQITSHKTGQTLQLGARDFRIQPDSGAIEAVSGRTQQGRCRNDWGDWFGCSNGTLLRYYGEVDRYQRRNPFVAPGPAVGLSSGEGAQRLFPPGNLVRFELSGAPGRATSACGLGIYRDTQLGSEFFGNAFVCEPVHQVVHRMTLRQDGLRYRAERADDEPQSEFLSSTDRWFRPVQARTGSDGALWVVDMYRYVIEHSRWIPQATLAQLDVFAGRSSGRIYRVAARSAAVAGRKQALPDLSRASNAELAETLLSTNGTLRDLAHQMLVWRQATDAVAQLESIAHTAPLPQSRVQALGALSGLGKLSAESVRRGLADGNAEVVRQAVGHSEPLLDESVAIRTAVMQLAGHANPRVRRQVAWSLGEGQRTQATEVLAALASSREPSPPVRAAVLSSLHSQNVLGVLREYVGLEHAPGIFAPLIKSAIQIEDPSQIGTVLQLAFDADSDRWRDFSLLAECLDAADARAEQAPVRFDDELSQRVRAAHSAALEKLDIASLDLLGRHHGKATTAILASNSAGSPFSLDNVVPAIAELINARYAVTQQLAAIRALARTRYPRTAGMLIRRYRLVSPGAQSAILDALLSRNEWTLQLLTAISAGELRAGVLDAERRARLLASRNEAIRQRAAGILQGAETLARADVVEAFSESLELSGDAQRGRELFRKHCASCHRLEQHGHVVGPDLRALTNRDPRWLLTAVLDPNRDVDARYVSWSAITADGRVVNGLVTEETATVVRIRESGGKEHALIRAELQQLQAGEKSLMPEGLEKDLTPQQVSDLLAYLIQAIKPTAAAATASSALPRRPPEIAPFLLDDSNSVSDRQRAIDARPGMGPAIIALLVDDLAADDDETQYRRIPWIFRTALAVGRRKDGGEIRDLLELSMPGDGQQLADWQAVAVGGGIINGLTQVGQWPGRRIERILRATPKWRPRWRRLVAQAQEMSDNPDVRTGTRYDALRIVALGDRSQAVSQLSRYLESGTHPELQMGAISGLADIESEQVAALLIESLTFVAGRNRQLALAGLLRTDSRAESLRTALSKGELHVESHELEALVRHPHEVTARNAAKLKDRLAR